MLRDRGASEPFAITLGYETDTNPEMKLMFLIFFLSLGATFYRRGSIRAYPKTQVE
jgi:hypothetical protein